MRSGRLCYGECEPTYHKGSLTEKSELLISLGDRLDAEQEGILVLTQRSPDKYLPEGQSLTLVHWLADSVDSPLEQRDSQSTALKGSVSPDINSDTVFAETFDNIYAVDTEQSSVIFQ